MSNNENNKKCREIKELPEQMFSYHIFLFPFRWKNAAYLNDDNAGLKEKFNLETFEKSLGVKNENSKWKKNNFQLNNPVNYNEYNYFYDFVREILYDLSENLQTGTSKNNVNLVRHFEYKQTDISSNEKPLYYHIKLKSGEHYALEIDSILLNVYATGTGILSFHLRNKAYDKPDDILIINQYGRRIYPPFFGLCDDTIVTGKKDKTLWDKQIDGAKNELADALWISADKEITATKPYDFSEYKKSEFYKHGPFKLPRFIKELFPEDFFLEHEKEKKENSKIYIRPATDDRMFVVSWYGNDAIANLLIEKSKNHDGTEYYNYEEDDWWYKYIFIDANSPMVAHKEMKKELINNHTYKRWADYGTLFGMSRYSLVMLTSGLKTLELPYINAAFTVRHLQTMYYKMAELVLLQRTTVLSFSDEVTHISDLVHSKGDDDKVYKKIRELYKHYILFVNKIHFREITAQEQGIEMYDLMQKVMRIERDVKELDSELDELNRFASMLADKKEHEEMKTHTWFATVFLPAMLLTGILGMSVMPKIIPDYLFNGNVYWPFWISIGLIILLSSLFYIIFKIVIKHIKKKNQ